LPTNFDKNYLGHALELSTDDQIYIGICYKCSKCNANILYTKSYPKDTWDYKFYKKYAGWINCELSCQELQIKNLLE